jgi:hypothetical protein
MKLLRALLIASAFSALPPFPGVLEKVAKIRIDLTVVAHPERVDDKMAASLVRYDLRGAVRDAHLDEGDSAVRAHFVLDEFSSESRIKRLMEMDSGRNVCTVDGKLVFEDSSGKELASVRIHVHGSIVAAQGDATNHRGREPVSDLEQRFLNEIEALK